ncbi:MAG: cytochrome-c peroxidase [Bacteroidetes bacterium]|nr:MAG: cytochrome-c peroxidase [Bacteroidota bacterium]
MKRIKWLVFCLLLFIGVAFKEPLHSYPFPELPFFPVMPRSGDNVVTREGAELGRYLFYDSTLSLNHHMSCASCHKQAAAFSDAPSAFSQGNNKHFTTRNTMPLFNLAWYPSFFWDGRAKSIEEQVFHPVRDSTEMNLPWKLAAKRMEKNAFYKKQFHHVFGKQKIDSVLIAKAIGQFLRTLISYQSKYDRVLDGKDRLTDDEYKGLVLVNDMTKGDCLHCHTTDANALGTTGGFSNNGLDAASGVLFYRDKGLGGTTQRTADYGKFKIPSLRNVAITAPYMHDGRFNSLEQVLDFYSEGVKQSVNVDTKMGFAHQGGARLNALEKHQIILFLKTLTDSTFITNPAFANPFK